MVENSQDAQPTAQTSKSPDDRLPSSNEISFDDEENGTVTLSEHLFQCHATIMDADKPVDQRLQAAQSLPVSEDSADAYISMTGPCQGHLPAFDSKTFRKAYTLLFWVRPRLSKNGDGEPDLVLEKSAEEGQETALPPANYLYRLSTQSQDTAATGVCVTCSTPWKLTNDNHVETNFVRRRAMSGSGPVRTDPVIE